MKTPEPHEKAPRGTTLAQVWRALRHPSPEARPPGVKKLRYRFPLSWLMSMAPDLLLGRRRDFRADCALAVRVLPVPPIVEGLDHIPRTGSFVLVANHYQRRDLWIGWSGALLCHSIWKVRPDIACTFVVEDRAVVNGASVRWTRPLFARVARVWNLLLVTPPEALDVAADRSRRHALLQCLRLVTSREFRVALCIMPEGIHGTTRSLGQPSPGSGRALLALANAGAPLVPAATWEEPSGALHLRLAPAWKPEPSINGRQLTDEIVAQDAMRRIAQLMPVDFRGPYVTP